MDILLASVQLDLRLALEMLLHEEPGIDIVGTASETEGLLALIRTTRPDLVILDYDLPGRPCAEALAKAQTADDRPAIIVMGKEARAEQAALAAGADAFVLKGTPPGQLLAAIRQVHARQGSPTDSIPKREE